MKITKLHTLLVVGVLLPILAKAQLEESIWFLGGLDNGTRAGIRFEGPDFQASQYNDVRYPLNLQENNIIVTDPISGEVVFYSDGSTVVDASHQPMPNGQNLGGTTSTMYGTAIVYDPTACDRYYIFYNQQFDGTTPPRRLYYSVIDLNLPGNGSTTNPLGDVDPSFQDIEITPNNVDCAEGLYAIPKGDNSRESWLFFADRIENVLYIYDVNGSGITQHATINLETLFPTFPNNDNLFGIRMLFKKEIGNQGQFILAPSRAVNQSNLPLGVLTFDTNTGNFDLSTLTVFTTTSKWAYGIAFSPDGSKIYYSDYFDKTLKQYDINTALEYLVATATHNGRTGGLGLGPDGRIYWANVYVNQSTNTNPFLSTVNAPNEFGIDCDFQLNSWTIGGSITPRLIGAFPSFGSFPAPPLAEAITPSSCGEDNGSATVVQSPGVEPLTYLWDNGETTATATSLSEGEHSVLIIDALGCEYQAFVTIEGLTEPFELENPIITVVDVSDCEGAEDGSLSLSANNLPASMLFYVTYVLNGEMVGPITLITDNNGILLIPDLGPGNYSDLVLIDVMGCASSPSGSWTISAPNQPETPNIEVSGSACAGEELFLSTTFIPNAIYNWTGPNGFSSNQSEIVLDGSLETAGIYSLTIIVDDCESLVATYEVILEDTSIDLGPDLELCDDATQLSIEGNFENIIWSDGTEGANLQINESGIFWVNAVSDQGCNVADTISVSLFDTPEIELPSMLAFNEESSTTISANIINGNQINYNWSPANVLSCTTCPNPQFIGNQNTTIYLEVSNEGGCSAIDSTLIFFQVSEDIYIPNAFSPNDDGFNDGFQIYIDDQGAVITELSVFDRWGELVHQSKSNLANDHEHIWDGKFRGEPMPTGVYVYYIEVLFSNQQSRSYKGDILLIR